MIQRNSSIPPAPRLAEGLAFICSTNIAMVIAQVCQPLADIRPKWVFAAASSERWKGWGSYFPAKASTSSRVTA